MTADQSDRRQGGQEAGEKQMRDGVKSDQTKDGKMIKGEVLLVEGDTYFVKGQDGKEVRCMSTKLPRKSEALSRVIVS
ncbi:MAG: hypothetical protein ABI988_21000, partial [Nitrospirota bacterium]